MNQPTKKTPDRRNASSLRIQYGKIDNISRIVGLLIGCSAGVYYYRIDPFMSLAVAGVVGMIFLQLTRILLITFGKGSALVPNGPFIENVANRTDEAILIDEFLKLGGKGAAIAAGKLSNNVGQKSLTLLAECEVVAETLKAFFTEHGVLLTEIPETNIRIKGIIGCGRSNMNPTLATINLAAEASSTQVEIKSVAKEGLIKQNSGDECATVISDFLLSKFKSRAE